MTEIRDISEEEFEEYQVAKRQHEDLIRALRFLVEHEADDDLVRAVAQAAFDNEQLIDPDLLFEGSA